MDLSLSSTAGSSKSDPSSFSCLDLSKTSSIPGPSVQKDANYYERRRRNNLAAKKSRDARKHREDQIAMRVAELEQENAILRAHVAFFNEELQMLQMCFLQKSNGGTIIPGKQCDRTTRPPWPDNQE